MANLFHFFVARNPGVTRASLENVLNEADDWFRYHEVCYVVETMQSPAEWRKKLDSIIKPNGRLFICKFDETHYHGWMAKQFWDWYQAKAPLAD
jgi:hypothetical protein